MAKITENGTFWADFWGKRVLKMVRFEKFQNPEVGFNEADLWALVVFNLVNLVRSHGQKTDFFSNVENLKFRLTSKCNFSMIILS